MNARTSMESNDTIYNQSIQEQDVSIMFAGHLLIVFYCLIFIFGLLGNSAVVYVAIRKRKYRNVTNCYVVNLAIADLLFLTVSVPYTTYLGLVDTYPFGNTVCNIYTYLAYVFLLATCYTLAAMSIDRYFYIVLPRGSLRWRSSQNAFIICLIIWATSLALIIPYHIISRLLTVNPTGCGMNSHRSFPMCFMVFCSYYAVPLMIIMICYTKLALHVIQSNRMIVSHMKPKTIPKSLKAKQRRVTRMVIVVTSVFAISWLPIHILELMKCANSTVLYDLIRTYPKTLYSIRAFTHALAYFNSCLNPYLYALMNRNFCFDLIDIIPSRFICTNQMVALNRKTSQNETKCATFPNDDPGYKRKVPRDDEDDDDEDEDEETTRCRQPVPLNIDAACQVELLEFQRN